MICMYTTYMPGAHRGQKRIVLVRVSITVKRYHDHGNSYKGKHLIEVAAYSSEVQSIIIMARSMVSCRQTWYWLHLDQKATGSRQSHWAWLEHI